MHHLYILQTGASRIARADSDTKNMRNTTGSVWVLTIDSLLDLLRVLWLLRHRTELLREQLPARADMISALHVRLSLSDL